MHCNESKVVVFFSAVVVEGGRVGGCGVQQFIVAVVASDRTNLNPACGLQPQPQPCYTVHTMILGEMVVPECMILLKCSFSLARCYCNIVNCYRENCTFIFMILQSTVFNVLKLQYGSIENTKHLVLGKKYCISDWCTPYNG